MLFRNHNSDLVDYAGRGGCCPKSTTPLKEGEGVRVFGFLSRFWRLDDDGSYIIILTTNHEMAQSEQDKLATDADSIPLPQLTVVCTVSPRRDYEQFDDDIPFALITCTIQVQDLTGMWTDKQFLDDFLTDYLTSLLEVRQAINSAKYDMYSLSKSMSPDQSEHGVVFWLGPPTLSSISADADTRAISQTDVEYEPRRRLMEKEVSGRFEGVATVQPGLDENLGRTSRMQNYSGSDGRSRIWSLIV